MKKSGIKFRMNTLKYISIIIASVTFITSCNNDDPVPNKSITKNIKYGIATSSGAWPNMTTYIQGVENLDFTTIDNKKAKELSGTARVIAYGKNLFALPFGSPAKLVKYTFDANGLAQEVEKILVPGSKTFSTIHFKSETVAYATLAGGISKLIKFNPKTMRIEDEISLKMIIDKFPEATRRYYPDIVERNNKLFMGVHYEKNFTPINEYAYVAIINLETNKVEKVIEDKRTGMVFGGQSPNAGLLKMENGDIYVQTKGTGNSPSGLLKIKNGTTEFDTDYFFDLTQATGNTCMGIYKANNRFFTAKVEDENDFWETNNKPQFKYYEIDILNKKSKGAVAGLPTTYGNRTMNITVIDKNEIVATISTNEENAVYKLGSGTATKLFSSTGGHITGFKVLK